MCGGIITSNRQKVDISRGQYLMKNIETPLYNICPRTGGAKAWEAGCGECCTSLLQSIVLRSMTMATLTIVSFQNHILESGHETAMTVLQGRPRNNANCSLQLSMRPFLLCKDGD